MAGLVHEVPTTKRPIFLSFLLPPSFFSSLLFLFFFSRLLARFVSSNGNPVAIIVKSRNKPCFCWSMLHCRQGWMWRVLREFGENSSRSSCERLACNSEFFFFFEKKLGRMAPRRGRNFWARIQREEFCRVIEISYGFFFPSKLKLKLFFFFIEFEFTFFKRSYRF